MSLPISSVVDVTISTTQGIPPKAGFGIMGLLSQDLPKDGYVPAQLVTYFASITEVAEVYDVSTETYKQAQSYFSPNPRPDAIAVVYHETNTDSAILLGGSSYTDVVATWGAIIDGSFVVSFSSGSAAITAIDFTGVADLDAIAAKIQTALRAIVQTGFTDSICEHSASENKFIIRSGDTGSSATVSVLSAHSSGTDVSTMLAMTTDLFSRIIKGASPLTPVAALTEGEQFDNGWYGVCINKLHRDQSESEDVAEWAQARIKWFSSCTNDPTTIQLNNTNFASKVMAASYDRTSVNYSSHSDEYPECAAMGRAFVVDFSAPNSTITMKFKSLAGITAEKLTSGQKGALDSYRCNAMIIVGGSNMYAESFMSYNLFQDTRHGIDWLQGEMESNVFGYLLSKATKVALTDAGAVSLEQQVIRALDTGLLNGLIGTGTTLEGEFLGTGYKTSVQKVADMNPTDKQNRIAPTIYFVALLAGAVHSVQVTGVVEQ